MPTNSQNLKGPVTAALAILLALMSCPNALTERLKGKVEENDTPRRLPRPELPGAASLNNSLEITTLQGLSGFADSGLMQSGAQSQALSGKLSDKDFSLPAQFKPRTPTIAPAPRQPCVPCIEKNGGLGGSWQPVFVYLPPEGMGGGARLRRRVQWDLDWTLPSTSVRGTLSAQQTSANLLPPAPPMQNDSDWLSLPPVAANSYTKPSYKPPPMPSLPPINQDVLWNEWYKQVASAIYQQWSTLPKDAGSAQVRVTVTRQRNISMTILNPDGLSDGFKNSISKAVMMLNGASVLKFPVDSQRFSVNFQAKFATGTETRPGLNTSGVSDVETVRMKQR